MGRHKTNKKKIINDPVHGFINIPSSLIYDLVEHPVFQRLRRIKQLGLTHYVYPGATHTRFQHTLGALHLMILAINSLRSKGVMISSDEEEATQIAILLHDIGHGPFSHALEESLIDGISHEDISLHLMQVLNQEFKGKLELAIQIFQNSYPKKFLHQLVSSQLDMDRMDYLKRDSFYTGVTEGTIGTDRIIKMLDVYDDHLVIEAKGIYSIEKFLMARRLMYWQVYFHKTVIASEFLLVKLLQRAKEVFRAENDMFAAPPLKFFLESSISQEYFQANTEQVIQNFLELDDSDIMSSAKQWCKSSDKVLSLLSSSLISRKLPKTTMSDQASSNAELERLRQCAKKNLNLSDEEASFLVYQEEVSNSAYSLHDEKIQIKYKNGDLTDIAAASDILNIPYLYKSTKKHFICSPKDCGV